MSAIEQFLDQDSQQDIIDYLKEIKDEDPEEFKEEINETN